jgi:hypothetical protein
VSKLTKDFIKGFLTGAGVILLMGVMVLFVINFSIRKMILNELSKNKVPYVEENNTEKKVNMQQVTQEHSRVDDFAEEYKATERRIKEIRTKMESR